MRYVYVFIILLMFSFIYAQSTEEQSLVYKNINEKSEKFSQDIDKLINDFLSVSFNFKEDSNFISLTGILSGAILMSISAAIIIYMLSNMFLDPRILGYAKHELYQAILSTLIISIGIYIINIFVEPLAPIRLESILYTKQVLSTIAKKQVEFAIGTSVLYLFQNVSFVIRPGKVIGLTISLASFMRPLTDSIGIISYMFVMGLIEWVSRLIILYLIEKTALTIFLPIALVLRVIPPLRGAGDALLAITLALYFVYPFIIYANSLIYNYTYQGTSIMSIVKHDLGSLSVTEFLDKIKIKELLFNHPLSISLMLILLGVIKSIITGSFLVFIGYLVSVLLGFLIDSLYLIFLLSMIFPLFNISFTLIAMREIGRWLNTDINLAAFARLI